jgi:hypothetical protein
MASNPKHIPVENHKGYSRDTRSKAIVSVDQSGYEAFIEKKREKREMKDRLAQVEASLDRIIDKLDSLEHLKND